MNRLFYEINRRSYFDSLENNSRKITRVEDSLPYRTKNPNQYPRDVLEKQFQYNGQRGSLIYTKDTSIKSTPVSIDKYGNDFEIGLNNTIWNSTKRPVDVSGYIIDNKYVNKYPVAKSAKLSILGIY